MKTPDDKFTHVLGIDISKDSFHVALAAWDVPDAFLAATFHNTPAGFRSLLGWLAKHTKEARIHACMEATGSYSQGLALFLHDKIACLSVENPRRIKAYASCRMRRCKSDPADARLIALYTRTQQPEAWQLLSEAKRNARAIARHIESLQIQRDGWKNRLKTTDVSYLKKEIQSLIATLNRQIDRAEKELLAVIQADTELAHQYDLLLSICGVGSITASRLLVELPELARMESARQLASFAGVTPRHRQSGTSGSNFTPMSKTGSGRIRKILYWPAISAMRYNLVCKGFAQRLTTQGKKKMCIIGAIMNKLLRIVFGMLKHNRPFDSSFHTHSEILPSTT